MKKNFARFGAVALVLAVSACGGGGGGSAGGSSLASVPLSASNYTPVGQASATAVLDLQATSAIDTLAQVPAATSDTVASAPGVLDVVQAALAQAGRSLSRDNPAQSYGESANCPYGGSIVVTANDNNDNDELDGGDSASATFNGCVVAAGAPAVNGGIDLNVVSLSGSSFSLTIAMHNLSAGASSLNGSADISVTSSGSSIVYHDATSTRNGVATVYDFSVTTVGSGVNARMTIAGTLGYNGVGYTLSTPQTIVMGSVNPASGTLRVADSAGGWVDVVMRSTDFDLALYLPGDSTRDALTTMTWAQLRTSGT